jgi:glycosyltransferase involved in cell wall biosynthesis
MQQSVTTSTVQLSVVVPLFNEEANIEPLVAEIHDVLGASGASYELLLIDDASSDKSPAILADLASSDPRIRVVRHRKNLGQSAALVSGFERARGEIVITLDADLQNDPADIPRLLAELDQCDVVCGVRTNRQDNRIRKLSSKIANSVRNRLTHDSITDVGCSLRVCRTPFFANLPTFDGMHRFLPTLLKLNGARVTEIPVNHRPRAAGESKYGVGNRLWRGIADLLAVRWLQRRFIDRSQVQELTPE